MVEVEIPEEVYLPCYRHLLESRAEINILWGGRDSGKSHFLGQKMITKCMQADYFKCILTKKTANTIEESQYETLEAVVKQWKLERLFKFRTHPIGIECINGNRFLGRGLDDPDNIKSIKDPTDVWWEEGHQATLGDFITVASSLRSNEAEVQQWFSLNPETDDIDFEEYWLYKTFFKERSDLKLNIYENFNGVWRIDIPNSDPFEFRYTSTHTTYHDNEYVKPARKAFLEQIAFLDPYLYQVYTLGRWGRRKNQAPFFFAYSKEKHLGSTHLVRSQELMLTFDFNKNPITAQAWQYYGGHLYGIEAIKLENSDIYKLCDYILLHYPNCLYVVTGDATGQASSALVQDNLNFYTVIKQKLNLSSSQIKVPTVNPSLKENQVLCNAVLHLVPMTIDSVKCVALKYDFENVRTLPDGTIEKGDRNDPAKQADQADAFRYLCNQFFKWVLKG